MNAQLTLMDLLNARENRVRHQKELLDAYPGAVLISMTLNIPGPVKDSPQYRKALETGFYRLTAILSDSGMLQDCTVLHEEIRPLITGSEAYLLLRGEPLEIKKAAVSVEEGSDLGRLFDIDVLTLPADAEGGAGIPNLPRSISRSRLGACPRRCLLCEKDAKVCARSQTHTVDQLLEKINKILSDAGL